MKPRRTTRKPVDRLNGFDSREAIWTAIRARRSFTVKDVHLDTTLEETSVRDYIRGLTNAGYLEEDKGQSPAVFSLIKDVGIDAPRVRKDGSAVTQGQGQINLWRTMRILRVFTARDLAVAASTPQCPIKLSTAEDYISHLCRAGYLRRDGRGGFAFLAHMFTGPKPPMIQRVKRVWDANLKQVMWSEDGGGDDGK
jgi:hypothetical protein